MQGAAGAAAKLESEFKQRFGFAPQVQAGQITPEQCGVTKFLSGLTGDSSPAVEIRLESDRIKSGESISVSVSGLDAQNRVLYLVDHQGVVQSLNARLKRVGDGDSVRFKLQGSAQKHPSLLLALTSEKPLTGLNFTGGKKLDALPLLHKQLGKDGAKLNFAFAFFTYGGS